MQPAIDGAGDAATVVSVLTQSREDYRDLFSECTALQSQVDELTAANQRLTDTNRELYLRIGSLVTPSTQEQGVGAASAESRADTITCADLFKED